tara:strand:+ start:75185 stop:75346 length:162 start_codon:yes stop_codon:yes gene_type:complete
MLAHQKLMVLHPKNKGLKIICICLFWVFDKTFFAGIHGYRKKLLGGHDWVFGV